MQSVLEDTLLDIVQSDDSFKCAESRLDRHNACKLILEKHIYISDALLASGFIGRLSCEAHLINASTPTEDVKLNSLLMQKAVIGKESPEPIVVLSHPAVADKASRGNKLCIRVPDVTDNDGAKDNLAHYLNFALAVLGIKSSDLHILKDKEAAGTDCVLPAGLKRMMTKFIQSSKSTTGSYDGDVYKFRSGFQGTLPEILVAIRLLRAHQDGLRTKPKKVGATTATPYTTPEMLREMFNEKSGLKDTLLPSYGIRLVKGVLAAAVRSTTTTFPGAWISSSKKRMGVANSEGLLAYLGYMPVTVGIHKVHSVLSADYKQVDKGEVLVKKDYTNKDTSLTHGEFRVAALMSLPLINPNCLENGKKALNAGPFQHTARTTLEFYKEHRDIVDAVNLAYAIQSSLTKPDKGKSKSKPKHFQIAKAHLVNLTANKKFVDGSGKVYTDYKDIPTNTREFLQKHWHRRVGTKTTAEGDLPLVVNMDIIEETISGSSNSPTTSANAALAAKAPSFKRQKH
jgi:hypothetical protein